MKKRIAVIGAGSMGTAVSVLLAKNGHSVKIWSFLKEEADMINSLHEQTEKLPGVRIPEDVVCTNDLAEVLQDSELVALVIPTQTIRENAKNMAGLIGPGKIVACFSKGLEEGTGLRPSQVIGQELPDAVPVALSGPCHAEELAKNIPSAYVAASGQKQAAEFVQELLMSPGFRVYTHPDIVGVELGGALKNVIALCAGISDGLGFGDNTKAALMTRGIAEISRLGAAMGAKPQTFAGLAGIGDLIVTCTSMHSRNRRAGILIGQGKSLQQALAEVKMVVEGVATTKPAHALAKKLDVTMPITQEAYEILFNGKDAKQAVTDLMLRTRTHEPEAGALDSSW